VLVAGLCGSALLASCSSGPSAAPPGTAAVSAGCVSAETSSGGNGVLVGATSPVGDGGYVTDPTAWGQLPAATRQQLLETLSAADQQGNASSCVQTTADLHVAVGPPTATPTGASAQLVDVRGADDDGSASAALADNRAVETAGCRPGSRATTQCDTLFGFGQGTTPLTVSGHLNYSGTPVCLDYTGGRLCSGWFGAWGADGTVDNGSTGSGIGTSALALASLGNVSAKLTSSPTALYTSHAPAGQSSAVTVSSYITLLDITLQTVANSEQCAPTKLANSIESPDVATPTQFSQFPVSCVDETAFDVRTGSAAVAGPYASLLAGQQLLTRSEGTQALAAVESAASSAHTWLIATPRNGLPTALDAPNGATLLGAACPVLNTALAPGVAVTPYSCTQSSAPPWSGVVQGQSFVSAQLSTTAYAESGPGSGVVHVILAFDTVDVHECWPVSACR
jgi:hypothetical protein